ncbi:Acyl transferase domain-containing protein [Nonomuraea maritima]|uniref:Acyl transferase domain-containing protein n=1 Tax=Nonomuraea maritima TaxID=683260 RepID=A0A1G9GYL0_9ACTN|nr:type I polyketide synthase [Nonomuraea maritima]SDL05768.1 Acyl transferase domain-containing protein [Nonomuraea maritima]
MTELSQDPQYDDTYDDTGAEPIAIIGMSARVPGANDLDQFWRNLIDGVESVTFFTDDEQRARGATQAQLDDPNFVKAAPVMIDMEHVDNEFFGMSAREAELADPQQRVFLEQSHAALQDAGYDSGRYEGAIGVYAGSGPSQYQWLNLQTNPDLDSEALKLGMSVGNNIDYVATTVSYRLNLRGPAMTVTTACSSSLVALHLACEALRGGECDMALAGGVCVELPHGIGYPAMDGFTSSDGHVRPFDAGADGTIWGSGVGVVVVKRLEDALADGDHIRAVVIGNAINNDGSNKIGFSAPSHAGQTEVVAEALGVAGVDPRTIGYVEAHGTGTALGDPIEVAALTEVYQRATDDSGWCGIGSVKSNLGHLSQASGVVGVIKTVLAMERGVIPPTINFERPNPQIDFDTSPFYVVSAPSKWDAGAHPRRAAVSSFGIGGTNAHVVLQEAPQRQPATAAAGPRPLWLSARTESALQTMRAQLAEFLAAQPDLSLSDVAHTLRVGRADHAHRAAVVAADLADAVAALGDRRRCHTGTASGAAPKVAFLFSGQGAQYAGMGAELYAAEPAFAAAVDECAEILRAELNEDIRPLLFTEGGDDRLRETRLTQPALFTIEYALARLWQEWGARPAGMIGHSIGEYVAATLAGVFALPDALRLVAARGRLMQSLPTGSMLAVTKDEKDIAPMLPDGVSVATVNGPGTCVVAGTSEAVAAFREHLAGQGVRSTLLRTSHAFHSPMMDPILAEFESLVADVPRRAPSLPFLSNVTGDWITAEQATDPGYWAQHIRRPVRFADCVARLLSDGAWALVECGPGKQLASLARMQMHQAISKGALPPLASLPGPGESDLTVLYATVGRLWTAGVPVELPTTGRRVPLPGYPYERTYRFIPPGEGRAAAPKRSAGPRSPEDWFEIPTWRQVAPPEPGEPITRCLAFVAGERGAELVSAIRAAGGEVIEVRPGGVFSAEPFTVRPGERADYDALVAALAENGGMPGRVLHAWALDGEPAGTDLGSLADAQEHGLFSLLCLVQALTAAQLADGVELDVLTAGTEDVLGGDLTRPEHATVAGIARVVPLEVPGLRVRHLDLDPTGTPTRTVLAELRRQADGDVLALRGERRWVKEFQPVSLPDGGEGSGLRQEGVYLITGGLGGIGLTLAELLGTRYRARLVLLGRSGTVTPRAAATIARIEQAGGRVTVLAADVTDPVRLRQVRDETLAAYGALHGVVHAAGLPGGGMAEIKERAAAQAVLDPKLAGTVALWQAFGDLDLDFVALCSSVTAISGGFGQVDYCAANAFLDAYARASHRTRVISINWGAWLEVGMAAAAAPVPALSGDAVTVAVGHPVVRSRTGAECSGPLSAATHWVLDEHRIGDVPVLPATGQLECARAAFAAAVPSPGDGHAVELRDVVFLQPLAVPDGTTAQLTVAFSDDSSFEVRAGGRRHTQGAAAWIRPEPAASTDLAAVRGRLRAVSTDEGEEHASLLTFGPRWRSPERIWVGEDEELAFVEGTEQVAAEVDSWGLHPALLDLATSFGSGRGTGAYLPLSYGRLLVRSALPARFYSHLRRRGDGGGEVVTADLTLLDESGAVLVEIEEFVLRRIDADAVTGSLTVGGPASTATGIAPGQGAEAFVRVLAADLGPQIAVSATSLDEITRRERLTRESLEAPVRVRQEDFVAPEGELEAALAKVWSEILGVPEVGADDDFFDLGGNSLVAVQLIAQARSVAGVRLPMRTLFEAPSVRQMAAKVEQLRAEQQAQAPATTIPRLSRKR